MKKLAILLILFLISYNNSSAQTFVNYMNNNFANCMTVDATNLWVGTAGGIVVRNKTTGAVTNTYTVVDGMVGNYITDIAIDAQNNKWIATNNGLSKFDGTSFTNYMYPNLPSPSVTAVKIDASGNKWLGTNQGLSKFDGTTWTLYNQFNSGLPNNDITRIAIDNQGNIWAASYAGVTKFDGINWTHYDTNNGLPDNNSSNLYVDAQGNVWNCTYGGLAKFNGTSWTAYSTTNGGLVGNSIYSVVVDASSNIWIGFYGVSKFNGSSIDTTYYNGDLIGYGASCMVFDQNKLWVGMENGISMFDGASWTSFSNANAFPQNTMRSLDIDANGNILCGTHKRAYKFDGTTYTDINLSVSNGTSVYSIEEGNGAEVWMGTAGGVKRNNGAGAVTTYTSSSTSGGLGNNSVQAIVYQNTSEIWFGTWGGGASKFDGTTWTNYTTADGLAGNSVNEILVDGNDIWFATNAGVSKFDGTTWTTYNMSNSGLVYDQTGPLYKDNQGNLWIGTSGGGLSKFDGTNWINYTYLDGLVSSQVQAIQQDLAGNMWIGTNNGLSYFDGTNWVSIRVEDGLAGTGIFDIRLDAAGNKWLATNGGLTKIIGAPVINSLSPLATQQNSLVVYPNPSQDIINFDCSEFIESISIYNLSGQLVKFVPQAQQSINIQELPNGLYIIEAQTAKGILQNKITKL